MAGNTSTLAIRIVSDASKASQGFDEAESRVGGFQRGLDKASVAAAGVLAGVGALAVEAYKAASAMEQSSGAVESVFGAQAKAVKDYAAQAAQANGLAASAYQDSAALIGSQLKSLGFPIAQAADQTDGLIDTASDLAATFGGSTQDAVDALSSALKGERDPIERYGISLSQAAIDAKVAALGLDTSSDSAKRNADAQAALAIIAEQGAAAQGSFARESDTAAGQTQRAAAEFENAKAALGDVLLPIVSAAAEKFSALAGFLVENKDVVVPLIGIIAGMAVAILGVNAAVAAYNAVTKLAAGLQLAWNLAMSANPIMLIVLAVAAVATGIYLAYQKFDTFRGIVDTVGRALKSAFEGAKDAIQWVLDKIKSVSSKVGAVAGWFSAPDDGAARAGGVAGIYGAADGQSVPGLFGAASSSSGGGGSTAAGGPAITAGPTYNITVNGALDAQAVARQVRSMLRSLEVLSGRSAAVAL